MLLVINIMLLNNWQLVAPIWQRVAFTECFPIEISEIMWLTNHTETIRF